MTAPLTVYDHIFKNNLKTALLILLFPVCLSLLVWAACYLAVLVVKENDFLIQGIYLVLRWFPSLEKSITPENAYLYAATGYWLYCLVPLFLISLGWMAISYFFGDKMMLSFANAQPIDEKDNPKLYHAVQNVAMMAGLPMPKVYEIKDDSLNAFATGHSPKTASLAFTTGILKKLKPLELEAVIAHEMGHVGNRDIRLNLLIITGLSIFAFIADSIRYRFYSPRRKSSNNKEGQLQVLIIFVLIALLIFNFIIAPLLRLAISRTREYAADATGALITHHPQALANALEKIKKDSRVEILDKQPTMATACIADPTTGLKNISKAFSSFSSTHPPIDERIRRLRAM